MPRRTLQLTVGTLVFRLLFSPGLAERQSKTVPRAVDRARLNPKVGRYSNRSALAAPIVTRRFEAMRNGATPKITLARKRRSIMECAEGTMHQWVATSATHTAKATSRREHENDVRSRDGTVGEGGQQDRKRGHKASGKRLGHCYGIRKFYPPMKGRRGSSRDLTRGMASPDQSTERGAVGASQTVLRF